MNEFNQVDFDNLLIAYKNAIDINMITSVTDERGKMVYVNAKFCDTSKYRSLELVGQNYNIVNSGHHPREYFSHLWATIRSDNVWQGEIKNKAKDGSFYWVETIIIPIKTKSKRQYLSLQKEITERKVLEEKKEEYVKALQELFFMISHEIRGPVCTILGLTALRNNNLTNEDFKAILRHLKKKRMTLMRLQSI